MYIIKKVKYYDLDLRDESYLGTFKNEKECFDYLNINDYSPLYNYFIKENGDYEAYIIKLEGK